MPLKRKHEWKGLKPVIGDSHLIWREAYVNLAAAALSTFKVHPHRLHRTVRHRHWQYSENSRAVAISISN